MRWSALRSALCDLYGDAPSIRRIAQDALLPVSRMTFEGSSSDIWESVLLEAERRSRLLDLLIVASREYPENVTLSVSKAILESGGFLRRRNQPELEDDSSFQLSSKDRNEMTTLRATVDALGKSLQRLTDLAKESEFNAQLYRVRLENWQEKVSENISELQIVVGVDKPIKPGSFTISTLLLVILILVFLSILIIGFIFLSRYSPGPIPSGGGGIE